MRISRGKMVKLDFELKDCDGQLLEDEGARLEYLHGGFGGIFPKVEAALEGKEAGHEMDLTLEPADAFGEDEGARLECLHGGFGGIFPKVEAALEGKEAGHEMDLTLEPEDAFGEYDAE